MAIYVGNKEVNGVYLGKKVISAVYWIKHKGSKCYRLIYSSFSRIWKDRNVWKDNAIWKS